MTECPLSDVVVIFDLDGTLVDSAPDLCSALNHVLKNEGLDDVPLHAVRAAVGHGARASLKQAYLHLGAEMPDDPHLDDQVERFVDYYRDHIVDESCLFEGAVSCMNTLEQSGAKLAVCTNKMEGLAFSVLEALGVKSRFEVILGRDSLAEHKPSGLPLKEILSRTGRAKGVMIGDTMTDVNAARNAGLPCAFATFGYGEVEGALGIKEQRFNHFEALPELILQI